MSKQNRNCNASSAISKLGLAADEVQRLQANVAVGYAVTYIFGSFGAIIVCVNLLPKLMGRSIRDDAIKAEAELLAGIRLLGPNEQEAAPDLVGRIYRIDKAAGKTIAEIEAKTSVDNAITIERVKRANKIIGVARDLRLEADDIVLIAGRRKGVVAIGGDIGVELQSSDGMEAVVAIRDVTITAPEFAGKTVAAIKQHISSDLRHGIYVVGVKRADKPLPLDPDTVIKAGDVVSLYGTDQDLQRVAQSIGPVIVASDKTDFVFHGLGIAIGLLIGLAVVRVGSIPLTLGSGGGALLSGLLFGWYRSRNMTIGNMPTGASTLLRDLGLAGFVAVVGLQSGLQAVQTIASSGLSIFLIGVVVTILPLIITMLFGRYVLKYDNVAVFAGALSGSRSANPAFGEILDKAGNSIPTTPFAITYALANVFLTLLGPLVVAFS